MWGSAIEPQTLDGYDMPVLVNAQLYETCLEHSLAGSTPNDMAASVTDLRSTVDVHYQQQTPTPPI